VQKRKKNQIGVEQLLELAFVLSVEPYLWGLDSTSVCISENIKASQQQFIQSQQ
jgi:hypothetical protein